MDGVGWLRKVADTEVKRIRDRRASTGSIGRWAARNVLSKRTGAGSIRIRSAREDEIPALCRLMRRGYASVDVQGTIYESAFFDRYLAARQRLGDLFLVAVDATNEGSPVGFAHLLPTGASVHVNHLLVRDSCRGQGLGRHLLHDIAALANEQALPVTLDVNSRNPGAMRFYANAGFKVEKETPVCMISRRSGVFPEDLVANSSDYSKYGFCYVHCRFAADDIRIGIVGRDIVRLFAEALPADFDWGEFLDWAQWANVYIYGRANFPAFIDARETWAVLRMKR